MSVVIKKIRFLQDESGKPFVYYAWDDQENRIITPDSPVKPEIVVYKGMVTQILPNGLDIVFPKFEPFPADKSLHFFKEETVEDRLSEPYAWELSMKLLRMLMDGSKLIADYEEKLKIVEDEFDKFGDAELKEYVLSGVNRVIARYKKTNIWDFGLLEKADAREVRRRRQ